MGDHPRRPFGGQSRRGVSRARQKRVSQLTERLDRLRALRATGRRAAESEGEKVEFRSDAELAAAVSDLERQIAAQAGKPPARVVYINSSKGT